MLLARKIILLLAVIFLTATANVEAAEENNLPFDVVADAYSESGTEAIALIRMKTNGALALMVAAKDLSPVGIVPYTRKTYDFYLTPDEHGLYSPLIFEMLIPQSERGQLDDNLGEWDETIHTLPIYALFNVQNGQVICQKPFYSAGTMNPSHYHDTVKNPNHERLIEILMTVMPRLHEVIAGRNISLP